VVNVKQALTTETQRTQRTHRESQIEDTADAFAPRPNLL
jgi:hypothetical protein